MAHPKVANNNKKNPSRDFKKEIIAKKKHLRKNPRHTQFHSTHTNTSRAFISLLFFSRNQFDSFLSNLLRQTKNKNI
jgi:hypothetical protein